MTDWIHPPSAPAFAGNKPPSRISPAKGGVTTVLTNVCSNWLRSVTTIESMLVPDIPS